VKSTVLGNYEILDKLGEGGMGEVWRARDTRLSRTVAVKILPAAVSGDPGRRARFEREARALAALNHPNIVAVYDTGTDEGRSYIVSELVDGESLREVIKRGRMSSRKLIDAAVQIADAIAAAHATGIVHRDLKPENIMVTPDGRIKVLDFGLAKQAVEPPGEGNDTKALSVSEPGVVMGTVGYMSPEQVRGETLDHRSDIFSFGAVLSEMITGKRAFHGGSAVETMHAILREDAPDLPPDAASQTPALGTIVRRCLEKRPQDRFQSAADLAFALRSIAPTSTSGGQAALKAAAVPGEPRWLWPAVAALAGILFFAVGFVLRDRTISREPPRYQPLTFRSGLVTNARFTPDGRNVIYSANWDSGPGRVYLAVPGNPESRDLDLPDGSIVTGVSANGEIAFLMGPYTADGTGTLSRASISGGQMRPALDGVRGADWAPDGSALAVLRQINGKYRLEYPIGKVLADNLEWPLFGLRVSPDGNRIAYVHYYKGSSIGLSIIDRSGKSQFIAAVGGQLSNLIDPFLCWRPDGREIWYRSFDLKEWGTIYAIDTKGHQRMVARVPGHVTLYDIAADGRVLLRTDTRQEGILGVAPGETVERDLSCLDASELAGISDDGRVIATTIVGESGGVKGSVYLRKTDGSPPIRVGDGAAWAISPDGKWISAYASSDPLIRRFVLLPTGAGEEREISIAKLHNMNAVFGWSQDGKTLFVHGPGATKNWQNYLWNPKSGDLHPIGPEGVGDGIPLVSPDRGQILATGPDSRAWVYPVDAAEGKPAAGISEHDVVAGWGADGRSLYVVMHHDQNKTLPVSSVDVVTGERKLWKEIKPSRPVDQVLRLRVTPDGRAYAYNYIVKTSELYVAEGMK